MFEYLHIITLSVGLNSDFLQKKLHFFFINSSTILMVILHTYIISENQNRYSSYHLNMLSHHHKILHPENI